MFNSQQSFVLDVILQNNVVERFVYEAAAACEQAFRLLVVSHREQF